MRAQPGWAEASRRLSPYLDPAIGIVAAALALASLLTTDLGSIDPRLEDPDIVSAVATVAAAGALAWRRSRPVASYAVHGRRQPRGEPDRPLHRAAVGADAVQPLLAGRPRPAPRRADRARRRGAVLRRARRCSTYPTSVRRTSCSPSPCWWRPGRSGTRSGRGGSTSASRCVAAVTEERLRIARELHDVVAHSMSLIAVQAGVGAHVIRTDPAAAEPVLEVIADTSRGRSSRPGRCSGMLRETTEDGTRPPTQGLDDIDVAGRRRPGRRASTSSWSGPATARERRRRRLADGVPRRPGVADQRHQALRGHDSPRSPWQRPTDSRRHRGDRPRPGAPEHRTRRLGARAARSRRAGPPGRRHPRVGVARRRVPGARRTARTGADRVIRVAVVDDQDLVRAGFVLLLRSAEGIEVVGEASDGLEAITLCRRTAPDVVLMDVRMPHLDGLVGDPHDPGRPGLRGHPGGGADDVRRGRARARGAAVGCERVPAQGHPPRPAPRGDQRRRGRRGAAAPAGDPAPDRTVRRAAQPSATRRTTTA